MGTRHLIAVHKDGAYPIAQYGQFDGYPDGQGVDVLEFLRNGNVEGLKRNLSKVYEPTPEEVVKMWASIGVDIVASKGMVEYGKGTEFGKKYPSLHRETSSSILDMVADSEGDERIPVEDYLSFAGESLFCEWAYVIDFDLGTFEVYEGFNKTPVPADSRFANLPVDAETSASGNKYYQVALAQTWKLDALPTEEEFLAAFSSEDEAQSA